MSRHNADEPTGAAERIARAWALRIAGTSYVSLGGLEVQDFLTGLAHRLLRASTSEPFNADLVHEVGATLVEAHFTQPASLEHTIAAMAEQFDDLPADRLAAMHGALASGYTNALRNRVLEEQEEIRTAALWARTRAEEAKWASEARFRAMFTEAAIGIMIAGVNGWVAEVNQALCTMLGYSKTEFQQLRFDQLTHPDDPPTMWDDYREIISGNMDHLRVEKPYQHRDGHMVWTDLVISLIRDQAGRPRFTVAMIEDITDRHLLQQRLRYQALHDPLTRLPNRTLFFERLSEIFCVPGPRGAADPGTHERRLGVCYLDVDGFKVVNDTLGHDIGDQLLRQVGQRLDRSVTSSDRLVARVGGDEFVMLFVDSKGVDEVAAVAQAALVQIRAPIKVAGHEISVSASIGVVERPVSETTAAEIMKAADTTLYWAKADGRNRVALFDEARHKLEVSRYELAAAMPAALEREEFFVEYQPLVTLADGALSGVEALVRWRHPALGVLGPDQFIDLAEETGLIVPLGRWVLQQSCRQAAIWRRDWPEIPLLMSVNLAVRQVKDPGLVDDIASVLAETGMDPATLQMELTESAVMGTDEPLGVLNKLAALGVKVAIDDFGTGYSNLAYLRSLPVNSLKLAGSFVSGLRSPCHSDPVDEQIIKAIIALAHALGLAVTAEGIETIEQTERLLALGCDTGQGWYFAEPGPAEALVPRQRARTATPTQRRARGTKAAGTGKTAGTAKAAGAAKTAGTKTGETKAAGTSKAG